VACISRAARTGWPLIGGLLFLSAWGLSAQSLVRAAIDTWPTTTYYLGFAEFEEKIDGQIRVAAGGRYTLYLNGDLVGTDDDPNSLEVYEVSFKRRTNNVAVVVEHGGTPGGYGLFCVLEAEGVLLLSSPEDRSTPWFWTGHPLKNEEGAAWTKLKLNKLATHEEDDETVTWSPAQAGTLDPRDFSEFADLDLTRVRSVAGFPGGMDGNQSGLQLRTLEGQNAAFNTFSADPKLVDGDVNTSVSFRKGSAALLNSVEIDLGRLITINRVRVITDPPSKGTYEDASLRGYSILVSKDGVNYLEVGAQNQITSFQESEVVFPLIPARYVRLTVTEFSNRNANPRLGEMEVFGEGIEQQGTYLSPPLNLGAGEVKNFDRALWFGEMPPNTEMDLRFRSGDDGETWSAWSAWSREPEILLSVPEPRRLLQFQVRMQTRELDLAPRLDSLIVLYDGGPLPAARALASVSPVQVPIGMDTTFAYTLEVDVRAADAGVKRLVILTSWPAELDLSAVQGPVAIDAENTYATNDSLVIAFTPPISSAVELVIPFNSRLLSATHTFRGMVLAPDASSPLHVQEREGTDPLTGLAYSLTVEAMDFAISVLEDVQAHPRVFSPNGDQVNEQVVVGFTLARVSGAPVRIEIYDLSGTLVRTLPERRLDAGRYAPVAGQSALLPGRWDGRADSGELLPPGMYLYRVVVDVEPEAETASGVVGIVY